MVIVIVGESASGKTTAAKALEDYGYKRIVSYTSRPPREKETDGLDYFFLSQKEFLELLAENKFAETGEYRGWYYGSLKSDYLKDNIITVLTPHGLRQIKKSMGEDAVYSVYLEVSRRDRLIKMLERGDDIEECYRRSLSDVGQFDGIEDEVDMVIKNKNYIINPKTIAEIIVQHIEKR